MRLRFERNRRVLLWLEWGGCRNMALVELFFMLSLKAPQGIESARQVRC